MNALTTAAPVPVDRGFLLAVFLLALALMAFWRWVLAILAAVALAVLVVGVVMVVSAVGPVLS